MAQNSNKSKRLIGKCQKHEPRKISPIKDAQKPPLTVENCTKERHNSMGITSPLQGSADDGELHDCDNFCVHNIFLIIFSVPNNGCVPNTQQQISFSDVPSQDV